MYDHLIKSYSVKCLGLYDHLIKSYSVKCLGDVNEAQIYLFVYFQRSFNKQWYTKF